MANPLSNIISYDDNGLPSAPLSDDIQATSAQLPDWVNKLTGGNGQERYQTWPEQVVRQGFTAAHDVSQSNPYSPGSEEANWYEDQRANGMVPAALNMSALAGGGALTGRPGVATVGSGPVRPNI